MNPTLWLPTLICALLSCSGVFAKDVTAKETSKTKLPAPEKAEAEAAEDPYAEIERLAHVMEIVRKHYVDEDHITYKRLVDRALAGMLQGLDPHSDYMSSTDYDAMRAQQNDSYDGIGLTLTLREDILTILSLREDGPAARAGILAGDQLLQIDDQRTSTLSLTQAIQTLSGKPGEQVQLILRRPSTKQLIELELTREVLKTSTIKDAMLLHSQMAGEQKIGYLRILQFNEPTALDMERALLEMEEAGMQALVLDLRGNPGGLLHIAVDVLGLFVPPGTRVVTTKGRSRSETPPPLSTSKKKKKARHYPICVLINHGSASASEVVAGALQDLKRALIVGEISFGKGSVQSVIPLDNGDALRLTTAKYYTPSERTIHEHGVIPNLVTALSAEEELAINEWREDPSELKDRSLTLARLSDHQLERAVDVLKGLLILQEAKK